MDPRQQYQQAHQAHPSQQPYYQQQHHQHQHQQHVAQPQQPSNPRFSWQIPLSDAERQPLHQIDPEPSSPSSPSHPSQSQPRAQAHAQPPHPHDRFSYAQTPIEVQHPHFHHQYAATRRQPEPTIPQSPTSPHPSNLNSPATEFGDMSAISTIAPQLPAPRMSRPLSKEIGEDIGGLERLPEEYARPMPQEPHPAFFAPVVDTSPRGSIAEPRQRQLSVAQSLAQSDHSHHQHQNNYGARSPPASPGPIPIKTEAHYNNQASQAVPTSPTSPTSPTQPYSPHSNVPSSRPPIFAPDNPSGPNGMLTAEHKPGQIAHPNMDLASTGSKHQWKHSLCECSGDVGTCMTGVFCPCVLYGKTGYRLGLKSEKKDATEMLGWSWASTQCTMMAVTTFCGLCGLFPLIHRTRIRHQYSLEGSLPSDIVKACCCCCCSTIQNEREVRDREERANMWAGPSSGAPYARPSPMVYEPPPRG